MGNYSLPKILSISTLILHCSAAFTGFNIGDHNAGGGGQYQVLPLTFPDLNASTSLVWSACFPEYGSFQCARLDVPLDYSNPYGARASISIVKKPATGSLSQYKGMMMTNPGGPGTTGVDFLVGATLIFPPINSIGVYYDLIGWDPRGIGASIPLADCAFANFSNPTRKRSTDRLAGPYQASSYFQGLYNLGTVFGQQCGDSISGANGAATHMGSATVARDMKSIVDAYSNTTDGKKVGDSKKLNYWGFSYGTILGQVYAMLFPGKVGRVVLDGVEDAYDYFNNAGIQTLVEHSDAAVSTFFPYCNAAGPSQCSFYTGRTAHDIYIRLENMFGKLNPTKAFQNNWSNATLIEWTLFTLKYRLFDASYQPINLFPGLSNTLTSLEPYLDNLTADNVTSLSALMGFQYPSYPGDFFMYLYAIKCSDQGTRLFNKSLSYFSTFKQNLESQSFIAGDRVVPQVILCAGWEYPSNDIFAGPFGGETENPILFVSNTVDPITPIENGIRATLLFQHSQLLTIEGVGHTSGFVYNNCAYNKIISFFVNGTLPGFNNYCPLEAGPWGVQLTGPLQTRSEVLRIKGAIGALGDD